MLAHNAKDYPYVKNIVHTETLGATEPDICGRKGLLGLKATVLFLYAKKKHAEESGIVEKGFWRCRL